MNLHKSITDILWFLMYNDGKMNEKIRIFSKMCPQNFTNLEFLNDMRNKEM